MIVDQDAGPTLAEVKRGSNPEIRRSIVGQMLEYAAHASENWTARELRDAFENQTCDRHLDPDDELATLLQEYEELDVEGFWQRVAKNLEARRLRLLFVADEIPDPLARVVTFLNAQMPGIGVLAVEIKRFHGESAQTLVPRVIGRIATGSSRGQGRSGPKLTQPSFLGNRSFRDVLERLSVPVSLGVLSHAKGDCHVKFRRCSFSVAEEGCGPVARDL